VAIRLLLIGQREREVKEMRVFLVGLIVLFSVSSAFAGTYLFGYTPGGVLGGGVRFDLGPGVVTDLSLMGGSGPSGSIYSLYGDVFWGNWGVGLLAKKPTVTSDLSFDISLQYAVEQAVNDDISVGVLLILVNYDTTSGVDPNLTVMPAIAPYFVLAL
jgi:hypothetical protein